MKKKHNSAIWGKISIVLNVILIIIFGGYFFLDKLIIPKYFGDYGINGMGDLMGVISSLYKNPKQHQFVVCFLNYLSRYKDNLYQMKCD